ncbi:MAG: hypothetical protein RR482_10240, partial [Clostridia bacterium]
MPEAINWLLKENTREAKLARTVIQGVAGVAAAAVTYYAAMAPEFIAIVVCPAAMAVLSPIMDYLGER